MCRWLAYLGEPLRTSTIVLDAKNSIVAQSLESTLGAETVNGDGFGFGWYPTGAAPGAAPAVFHSTEPAWNDQNLRELTRAIDSPLFFAHVRAATMPPIQKTNCHPFRYENWMFMHNGSVARWREVRRELTFAVDPALYPHVLGTTDSEVLFHLALTFGLADDPIPAMGRAIRLVEQVGDRHGIRHPWQGTVAVSDGERIWAFRYSSEGRTRSLFHSADMSALQAMYPDAERFREFDPTARLVVSEPLTDLPGVFLEVPESTAAVLEPGGFHHQPFLAD